MAIMTTDPVCKEICDALGLKHVRKLVLTMEVDSIVAVDVEYFPDKDGVAQLPAILARYELVPKSGVKNVTAIEEPAASWVRREYIVDVVIDAVNRNIKGIRNILKD